MEDAALFYRHRAWTSFNGRRRYRFLSDEWREQVEESRRFIQASRDLWDDRPRLITRTFYGLGPRVRDPLRDLHIVSERAK
jgi:hypothetical protein